MLAARKKAGAVTEDKKKKERQLQRVESAPEDNTEHFVVHKFVIPQKDLGPSHGESDSDGNDTIRAVWRKKSCPAGCFPP